MKKQVLLVCPAPRSCRVKPGGKPVVARFFRHTRLSLLAVAAATPPDWEVKIVDEYVSPIDFSPGPTCVGLSFMTAGAPRAYEIAREFHRRGIPVLAGGYHPSFLPEEALAHCDAVCIGDAEPSWPQMLHDLELGSLQRVYRSDPSASLRGLSLPRRDLLTRKEYYTRNSVQTSRGCPNHCTFCSISSFYGARYRHRPVEEVLAEVAALPGRLVIFIDDNLVADRTYALKLFTGLKSLNRHWYSQAALTIAEDPELLEAAVAGGCKGLFVGIESISDESLRRIRKEFCPAETYRKRIETLHKAGIALEAGVIFGFDEDGPDVFDRTLDFLRVSHIELAQIAILTPLPGTLIYHQLEQQGRILTRDWSYYDFFHVVFQPKRMTPEDLQTGTDEVVRRFYSTPAILKRTASSLSYLSLRETLGMVFPLNMAAKTRVETWEARPTRKSKELHWLHANDSLKSISNPESKSPVSGG
ncbi:MAG: radical SAM protein [Chloroflexota bacterium]